LAPGIQESRSFFGQNRDFYEKMTDLGVDVIQGRGFPVFHPPLVSRDLLVAFLPILSAAYFILILPNAGRVYTWVLVG